MNASSSTSALNSEKFVFRIKTDRFEGPLELLLELVEKRKLLINDISLAEVTDEYMRTVAAMQERSLPHTAQFVALAATLLLLKSKSLLPVLELTEEEHERIDDLEAMLKHYQIYRDAGVTVREQFGVAPLYERGYVPSGPLFTPDQYCRPSELHCCLRELLHELPQPKTIPKVQVQPTITLEEMIERLHTRIKKQFRATFSELHEAETERKTVVVAFLAVLELCKQGTVIVKQEQHFTDFTIESTRFDTPQYG